MGKSLTFYLFLLVISLGHATSARLLNEVDQQPILADAPISEAQPLTSTLPSGQIPVASDTALPEPSETLPTGATPVSASSHDADIPDTSLPVVDDVAPVAAPVITTKPTTVPAGGDAANVAEHAQLSFFMHDILGGTQPSGRVVTGIVANSDVNNLPFSKPTNQVFPINGGVPLNTVTGVINNNNAPFLVGLNGSPTSTALQNNGNNNNNNVLINNGNNLPFVSAGQLPTGLTLQQLMFGSITVVDNEITEGHELGSAVLGHVQGFYLSSSLDGTSHTLVLTTLFHGSEHDVDDTISFFGIHRTGSPVSEIAVIGGTGKYEDARGYATIEALPQHDQHTTDGVETITQFNVYLTA